MSAVLSDPPLRVSISAESLTLRLQVEYQIRVQLLEIYNEQLRDLLVEGGSGRPQRLDIRSTAASGLNVPDARQVRC